jgi:raffinose/stachyose/melibiose transport system substrate-binding protein
MRKLLLASVAMATLLLTTAGAKAAPVEISFYDRYTTPEQQSFDKWLVGTFNDRNSGKIHVTLGGTPDETFKSKINSVLRSPDAPDVFFAWEGGWAKYIIDSGYAAPLDSYYAKYGWSKSLSPAGIALATFDGKKYFVPEMMSASVVWYRPDVFEKAHVVIPRTWDEFTADAKTFKSQGITPTMLANQQQWPAQFLWTALLVNKYGVSTYNQLLTRKIAWTDPRVVDAFAMMKQLADDGAFEQGANGLDVPPAVVPFSQGKVATWYQGSFMLTRFLDANGKPNFPLSYFPFPKMGDETPTISVFVENTLMINANSGHKDEAADFMNWVVSKEAQTKYALSARMLYPANIQVDLSSLDPMVKRLGDVIGKYDQATFMHVDHALSPAVSDPYLQALQAVLIGKATPQEAARTTEQAAEGDQGPVKP